MSSVASEHAVLPSRPHLQRARGHADGAAREPATPFRELLDSAGPPAEPTPAKRQTGPERAARKERSDDGKPANNRAAEAKPSAKDSADVQETGDRQSATEDAGPKDVTVAKDTKDEASEAEKPVKIAADPEQPVIDVTGEPKFDADTPAALDATVSDAEPPVTPLPPAPHVAAVVHVAASPESVAARNAAASEVAPRLVATVPGTTPKAASMGMQPATPAPVGVDGDVEADADALAVIEMVDEGTPVLKADQPKLGPQNAAPDKPVLIEKTAPADKITPNDKAAEQAKPSEPASVPLAETSHEKKPDLKAEKHTADSRPVTAEPLTKPNADAPPPRVADAAAAVKASTDAMQPLGAIGSSHATTAAATASNINAHAPALAPAPTVAVPLAGLAVEIAALARAGKQRFEIRLDPPELGRIDVRLDVDRDGHVTSRLVVDRVETLELLKRDATELQRALQQAGLKTSDNALEFSLRQQSLARDEMPAPRAAELIVPDDDPAPLEALRQGYGRLIGLGGGLDIRV